YPRPRSIPRSLAFAVSVIGTTKESARSDHPDVATALNDLAGLYQPQGPFLNAEPLYERSLAIRKKALGPDHPDVALSLNNLAWLYQAQGRYVDAEPLYKRSGRWQYARKRSVPIILMLRRR